MQLRILSLASVLALTLTMAPAAWAEEKAPTPTPAPAATTAAPSVTAEPKIGDVVPLASVPALQNVVHEGTEIRYIGDEYGLKGYFLTRGTHGQSIYVSPNGQGLLIGGLFGGDSSPTTLMQLTRLKEETGFDPAPYMNGTSAAENSPVAATEKAEQAPPADPNSPGEKLLAEMNKASWVAFGKPSAPAVSMFMDPNCDHCHAFFRALFPYTQQGKLYLRVLLTNASDLKQSPTDVVNILSNANPAAALVTKINGQSVPVPEIVNPRATAAREQNNALFVRWKLPGVPYTVYRSPSTGKVNVLFSKPSDMASFLADLGVK